jgi:hypothetical protein
MSRWGREVNVAVCDDMRHIARCSLSPKRIDLLTECSCAGGWGRVILQRLIATLGIGRAAVEMSRPGLARGLV